MFHRKDLTHLALDLTNGISNQHRFERLLSTVKTLFECDASALLVFKEQQFVPLAINGLSPDVQGRRFAIEEHPRLEAIARAGDVVRFPADSDLPDPYDSLIESHEGNIEVHACVGLPLMVSDRLIGALTIDSFNPEQFDDFSNDELRVVSALASASLHNALLMEQLEKLAARTSDDEAVAAPLEHACEMIGQSPPMLRLKKDIALVAETDMTVLILGETGAGKELVAAAIHRQSSRAGFPMVYLNCAALPESVAESELFGHVKGAFTGAISNRKGKFELADNGTLFLDEVGELSLALQSKLLRVLQYGDVQRVGDDSHLKVNTRIIAATNRDLKKESEEEKFRSDLYHRLSVFPVFVPPLRERGDDVLLLAGFFLEKCRIKLGLKHLKLTPASQKCLLAYSWPGNVRELEHCIHRASLLAKAEAGDKYVMVEPYHFEADVQGKSTKSSTEDSSPMLSSALDTTDLRQATDNYQSRLIKQALDQNNGNWAKTARQLKVDAGNLHRLAKRLGIK